MNPDNELESIESQLDDILESTRKIRSNDDAYMVLGKLVATTSRINSLMLSAPGGAGTTQPPIPFPPAPPSTPGIVSKLQGWIQKIKSALEALAKFLKAASYTVSVSVPWGLSVSITFNV